MHSVVETPGRFAAISDEVLTARPHEAIANLAPCLGKDFEAQDVNF